MFHIRLKELREKENLTQKQLAEILNISRSSLSSYETGAREPDFSILKSIAEYFNVTIDYLFDYKIKDDTEEEGKKELEIYDEIDLLNEESKEELLKYIKLLKVNEIFEKENDSNNIRRRREINA